MTLPVTLRDPPTPLPPDRLDLPEGDSFAGELAFDPPPATDAAPTRRQERAARDQLHRQLMQLPAAVMALRGRYHVIALANPAYQKLVGNRAVSGLPLAEAMPELLGQPFLPELDSVLRTGVPVTGEEVLTLLDRLGGGVPEECFFNYTYQPTFSAPDEVDGVLVFAFEVTSQVRARQSVASLVLQAARDDRRKDEFLAMLAHELRNPLAALSTALYLQSRREVRDEQERRSQEICQHQVSTLVRLVDDLLDVSRITRGRVKLQRERTDLATILRVAIQTTRPQFEQRNHQVALQVGAGSFALHADATRLEQVFTNLLINAAKYTDEPGRIEVRLNRESGPGALWACVEIADPGRGLAPEMREQIFDLFAQVDSSLARSEGGLGIGLTLVRSLVALHGGQIRAHSVGLGCGTTVTVRLPLAAALESTAATPDEPAPAPSSLSATRRRIVVVEDNEDGREMLRDLLMQLGHDVSIAIDGARGLELILTSRPDLAFIDIGLPGFDGYHVAREVRHHSALAATRLVALTGYGDPESRARARDAGFDAHLTKPFSIAQLKQELAATPIARLV